MSGPISAIMFSVGTIVLICAALSALMGGDRGVIGPSLLFASALIVVGLFLQG